MLRTEQLEALIDVIDLMLHDFYVNGTDGEMVGYHDICQPARCDVHLTALHHIAVSCLLASSNTKVLFSPERYTLSIARRSNEHRTRLSIRVNCQSTSAFAWFRVWSTRIVGKRERRWAVAKSRYQSISRCAYLRQSRTHNACAVAFSSNRICIESTNALAFR